MLSESQIADIKARHNKDGQSLSAISRATGFSYATVRKYVFKSTGEGVPRYADRERKPARHRADLEAYIRYNSEPDTGKQFLTIARIYELLEAKYGSLGYSLRTLQRYMREVLSYRETVAYVPLEHDTGCAQIDFGTGKAYIDGELREIKYLVLNFPHSGRNMSVVLPSENRECLLWGLCRMFKHIGGVPRSIRIDNASTMVDRGREYRLNDAFERFSVHYGFKVERCNPASGNEKGSVERGVSTVRKRLLSPIPTISDFESYNERMLRSCDRLMEGKRYGTDESKWKLWGEDEMALKRLPALEYEPCKWETRYTDKCGIVSIDTHRYSTSSHCASVMVHVKVGAFTVEIYDRGMKFVVAHKRCYYGGGSMDLTTYEDSFVRSPRALHGAGIATEEEAEAIASASKDERKPLVHALFMRKFKRRVCEYTVSHGHYSKAFEAAVQRGHDLRTAKAEQGTPRRNEERQSGERVPDVRPVGRGEASRRSESG